MVVIACVWQEEFCAEVVESDDDFALTGAGGIGGSGRGRSGRGGKGRRATAPMDEADAPPARRSATQPEVSGTGQINRGVWENKEGGLGK